MMTSSPLRISTIAFRPGSLRALFVLCALLTLGSVLSAGWQVAIKAEYGALELASFLCLSVAALVSGSFYREGTIKLWAVPVVFGLLALREMDFQNWWFEPGLLRAEIFNGPAALWQKIVSGAAMLGILLTLLTLFVKGARPALKGVMARENWALILFVSGLCVAASIMLDGVDKNLAVFNIEISSSASKLASYLEEIFEFGFAFSLVAAMVCFARKAKMSRMSH